MNYKIIEFVESWAKLSELILQMKAKEDFRTPNASRSLKDLIF